jgi:hypothetical protein
MEEDDKLRQQRSALRILTILNAIGVVVSIPLSVAASSMYDRADASLFSMGGLFGVAALGAAIGWATLFYKRASAEGLTRNEALRRLNQAAVGSAYPAYLGVAVAFINSTSSVIAPFGVAAVVNIVALYKFGNRVIDAQR